MLLKKEHRLERRSIAEKNKRKRLSKSLATLENIHSEKAS